MICVNLYRTEQKTLQQLRQVRIEKLNKLRAAGINPYPSKTPEFIATAEARKCKEGVEVGIVGRVMAMRGHGKIYFLDLFDGEEKMQCFFEENLLLEKIKLIELFDIGDFLHVEGKLFLTQAGELTVRVENFTLLSKSIRPLPDKWHGLVDEEERYRKRYLDFIFNKSAKEKIVVRAKVLASIREFMTQNGFLEVETPVLETEASGALAKPFKTHMHAFDLDLYLRICMGELWQKKLMVAGFSRTFEIGRAFRNEGVDREHNPDFTMMEYYWSYANYEMGMDLQEKLIAEVVFKTFGTYEIKHGEGIIDFTPPYPRVTFHQLFMDKLKIDINSMTPEEVFAYARNNKVDVKHEWGKGKLLDEIYKDKIRAHLVNPMFLIDHPVELKPLSKKKINDERYVETFQLLAGGFELSNCYSEINDPFDQDTRFDEQKEVAKKSDEETLKADESFIEALEHAMPPTCGAGIGIDRLVAILTDSHTLRETIAFPLMKPEISKIQKNNFEDLINAKKFFSEEEFLSMENSVAKYKNKFLKIDTRVINNFSGVKLGVLVLHGINNQGENDELIQILRQVERNLPNYFRGVSPPEHEYIIPWREAYKKFGAKPNKYLSSVENLAARILNGTQLHHVNKLVDIYNIISLKYLLPAGGEDTDKIIGNINLTIAGKNEAPVTVLGENEPKAPKEGEVIYKDDKSTICRRWNWREVERTALSEDTKNTFIVLECLPPVSTKILEHALDEMAGLVRKFCGGGIGIAILDENNLQAGIN
jgi:lysyl-tRNA synthetase class 2